MKRSFRYEFWFYCVGTLFLMAAVMPLPTLSQSSEAPNGVDKPVEEAFHNIQVFRGMRQSELLPVMHFMRSSLGVRCDYCHVAENGMYWKDEKQTKVKAREMIRMVMDINSKNFHGQPVVTCNTCHKGNTKPAGIPSVTQAAFENTIRGTAPAAPALPTVDTIFQNYVKALGGEEALSKVQSRMIKISISRPRLVDPKQIPIVAEIYEKKPNKIILVVNPGPQPVRALFNGSATWIEVDGKFRNASVSEQSRLHSLLTIYPLGNLKDQYQNLKVVGTEPLEDGVSAYVLEGTAQDKPQKLFFDAKTGLLVRRTSYTMLPIGEDPEQVDFSGYGDVDGVKMPFRVAISYLDNNHLNIVRVISTVENNVAVEDAKFAGPPQASR